VSQSFLIHERQWIKTMLDEGHSQSSCYGHHNHSDRPWERISPSRKSCWKERWAQWFDEQEPAEEQRQKQRLRMQG
jgi:hypothetical protein